jgi:TonB family protein
MNSGGAGSEAMGKMIALGLHPAAPSGPITVPGNRSGQFAATPGGEPNAPGTPDIYAGGEGPGGSKTGSGNSGGPGSGNGPGGPAGIYVGAGPVNPGAGVQGDKPTSNGAGGGSGGGQDRGSAAPRKEVATVTPPRVPQPRESRPAEPPDIEDRVFSGKKYYSLTINMPNLTSAGGSWIMRFAELNQTRQAGELTAPVAMNKVDPAYPPDLIKDRVEGTVTLYAVIHSDGSVSEIRVLRSLDDRLDENAVRALGRWHFRPATKNGQAVDLEAVVVIPFKVKARPY